MATQLEEYKRLRAGFLSYKFGFGSPKAKRLVLLERKLKKRGIVNSNGQVVKR